MIWARARPGIARQEWPSLPPFRRISDRTACGRSSDRTVLNPGVQLLPRPITVEVLARKLCKVLKISRLDVLARDRATGAVRQRPDDPSRNRGLHSWFSFEGAGRPAPYGTG